LDLPDGVLQSLERTLGTSELTVADSYRREPLRPRFVARRGILRCLLGQYLGVEPAHVAFTTGRHGKPLLAPSSASRDIHFNVADSEDLAVFAFCAEGDVGIDIERVRPVPDVDRLAQRFFTCTEAAAVCATPGPRKITAFLTCWTRKEAYLKALGIGLEVALDSFEVSVGPERPARLLTVDGSWWAARSWTMLDVPPVDGAVGALAVRLAQPHVAFWEWRACLHASVIRSAAASF